MTYALFYLMITEEEFNAFQEQLIDLGQTNFTLRSELDELKEENKQIPSLRNKYSNLTSQLNEMRERNSKTIKELNQSIANLKLANLQKEESEAKKLNNSLEEVSKEIDKISLANEDKENTIFEKKEQVQKLKNTLQKRRKRRDIMQKKLIKFSKFKKVLEKAPMINMYLEDLQSRFLKTSNIQNNRLEVLSKLDQEISMYRQQNEELEKEDHSKEIEYNKQLEEISEIKQKINKMKEINISHNKNIKEKQIKLNNLQNQIKKMKEERVNKIFKIEEDIRLIKVELDKQQKIKESVHKSFESSNELVLQEKQRDLHTIQKLRKELNTLIETGDSPGIPKIDQDLISQIDKIQEEEKQLKDKIQMLQQAVKLIKIDLKEKETEIIKYAIISEPTQYLLSSPEFQIHETILEELILQNKELMDKYNNFNSALSSSN